MVESQNLHLTTAQTQRSPVPYILRKTAFVTTALTIAGASWYVAVALTSPSDLTAIYNCSAFFAYAFSIPLLKDKIRFDKVFSVAVAIAGVLIVAYGDSKDTKHGGKSGGAVGGAPASPEEEAGRKPQLGKCNHRNWKCAVWPVRSALQKACLSARGDESRKGHDLRKPVRFPHRMLHSFCALDPSAALASHRLGEIRMAGRGAGLDVAHFCNCERDVLRLFPCSDLPDFPRPVICCCVTYHILGGHCRLVSQGREPERGGDRWRHTNYCGVLAVELEYI